MSNPASYADANPVRTGPYELGSYSSQKVAFKQNPYYWQKSMVHVPEVIFPSYVSNTTANPALDSGQIGYAGNNVANVQSNFLSASPANHTWTSGQPWFASNNVVTLWLNVTKAPLNDPKVRLAISAGINRQQLSAQGETSYEPPATSSSGLLLPVDNALLNSAYTNDLSPTSDAAKVSQLLTSDGYTKTGGKWMKNGQPIKFAIEDPSSYTDYATDAALIASQLNAEGFEVSFNGVQATQWSADFPVGNFQAMIHWGAQGPNPYYYFDNWLDSTLSAPPPAGRRRLRPVQRPAGPGGPGAVRGQQQHRHPAAGAEHAADHRGHPGAGDPAAVRSGLVRVLHQGLHGLADPIQPVQRPGPQLPLHGVHPAASHPGLVSRSTT